MSNQKDVFSLIKSLTGQGNILTVPRAFVDYTGSLETGLFLSQVIYWSDRGGSGDGWFYKTYQEWREEICLTEYAVRKASHQLVSLGDMETKIKKANGSPTVHYRLKVDAFLDHIVAHFKSGNCEIEESKLRNQRNGTLKSKNEKDGIAGTLTEITTKITKKNDVNNYSLDSNWAQVQKLWETNIGFLAPAIVTQAQALMDEIPQPAQVQYFQEAITRACAANARNWNYIKAILTRWIDQGGIDLNGSGKRQADPAESSPLPPTDPAPAPAPLAPHAATWEAARRLLAGSVTAATFDQVIAHCQAQPGHNGTFVLGVPADKLVHVRRAEKPILLALKQVTDVTELEVTTL